MNAMIEPAIEHKHTGASDSEDENCGGADSAPADLLTTPGQRFAGGREPAGRKFVPFGSPFALRGIPFSPLHDV